MNYKIFIINIILVVVSFTSGFFISKILSNTESKINASYQLGKNEGWAEARRLAKDRGVLSINNLKNQLKRTINGKVLNVNDGVITIEAITFDVLPDPNLAKRKIIITPDTKISKTVKKEDDEYKNEIDEYLDAHPELKNSAFLPEDRPRQYREVDSSFFDLAVGQTVTIKSDEDITDKSIITAKEIYIASAE